VLQNLFEIFFKKYFIWKPIADESLSNLIDSYTNGLKPSFIIMGMGIVSIFSSFISFYQKNLISFPIKKGIFKDK
jgi:hypothetical protein